MDTDLNDILLVEREAFKSNKEAELVMDILKDSSAKPILSVIAIIDNQVVGHILFTTAHLTGESNQPVISILAPLAIKPNFQKQGIGGKLIQRGIEILSKSAVGLIFVIGHPDYYPKHGFIPAIPLRLKPPYPIPKEVEDAWMVKALQSDILGNISGKVICCDALNKPEHWRE